MKKKPESFPTYPEHQLIGKGLLVTACVVALWVPLLELLGMIMDLDFLAPASTALYLLLLFLAAGYALYPLSKGYSGKRLTRAILKNYFCRDQLILLAFLVWTLFACSSMSSRYNGPWFSYNKEQLLDIIIAAFVYFPLGKHFARSGAPAALKWVLPALALALTVFMGYIIYIVCQPTVLYLPNGAAAGMEASGRLDIHCNPNTTGLYAATVLGACLLAGSFSKGFLKWLWYLMCPVHFFILVLSGSRSAYIAGAVAVAGFAAALFYTRSGKKEGKTFLYAALIFAAGMVAVYYVRGPFETLYESISHFKEMQGITQSRFESVSLNGRMTIYEYSLKTIVQDGRSFFFGSSPAGVVPMLEKISGGELESVYTHNQFLEVAVATGIPGLALFLWWEIRQGIRSVKLFLLDDEGVNFAARLTPFVILLCVVANLAEATLLWYGYVEEYLLFLLCGWVLGAAGKREID